jgi:hypothetical protein
MWRYAAVAYLKVSIGGVPAEIRNGTSRGFGNPSFKYKVYMVMMFGCSCGPAPQSEMVSRRRILSRSRDDLNLDSTYVMQEEEEDVWYQRDKLYKVRGIGSPAAVYPTDSGLPRLVV